MRKKTVRRQRGSELDLDACRDSSCGLTCSVHMPPKEDSGDDAIAASQRLQTRLQKLIDEAEAEEQQDKELTDTQVALRRYGLTREACCPSPDSGSATRTLSCVTLTRGLLPSACRSSGPQGPRERFIQAQELPRRHSQIHRDAGHPRSARWCVKRLLWLRSLSCRAAPVSVLLSAWRDKTAAAGLTLVRTEECGRIEDYTNPVVKDRWGLRLTALSNRSECHLQMNKWKLAQADAEAALEIDRYVRIIWLS